jgi:hypothetical protein
MKVTEVERLEGCKVRYRTEGMPKGVWMEANSDIDLLLKFVAETLGIKHFRLDKGKLTTAGARTNIGRVLEDCQIPDATLSRVRLRFEQGRDVVKKNRMQNIPEVWFLRLHLYSGIPVSELMRVALYTPETQPYVKPDNSKGK